MLKLNGKKAPPEAGSIILNRVDELNGMSNTINDALNKVKDSDPISWEATKMNLSCMLNSMEQILVKSEMMIQ